MDTLRPFQFRIWTLIAAMIWASIASWAITSRSELSYSLIFLLTLTLLLTSALAAMFQTGTSRAFAVGFLLFGLGHMLSVYLVAGSLYRAINDEWSPTFGVAHWLHSLISTKPPDDYFLANFYFVATMLFGGIGGLIASLLYRLRKSDADSRSS